MHIKFKLSWLQLIIPSKMKLYSLNLIVNKLQCNKLELFDNK